MTNLTTDDIKVIYASAAKILREATEIKNFEKARSIQVEAAAILTLCDHERKGTK